MHKNIKWIFSIFFSIFTFVWSIHSIKMWNNDKIKIQKVSSDIEDKIKEKENSGMEELVNPPYYLSDIYYNYIYKNLLSVDISKLKSINDDIIGFLKVEGTSINDAVVQTNNNTFYLTHSTDKTPNKAGAIFADYRNDFVNFDKNNIIYAHGRTDKIMFGTLKNTLDKSWYENTDNHLIYLSTLNQNTLWQIVSVYTIPEETDYITTHFKDNKDYHNFLEMILDRSIHKFNTTLNTDDKILTLSTCKGEGDIRIVVHAKLIKKQLFK